jgi:hypothetical protein
MRASSFRLLRPIVPQYYGIINANKWRVGEITAPHRGPAQAVSRTRNRNLLSAAELRDLA